MPLPSSDNYYDLDDLERQVLHDSRQSHNQLRVVLGYVHSLSFKLKRTEDDVKKLREDLLSKDKFNMTLKQQVNCLEKQMNKLRGKINEGGDYSSNSSTVHHSETSSRGDKELKNRPVSSLTKDPFYDVRMMALKADDELKLKSKISALDSLRPKPLKRPKPIDFENNIETKIRDLGLSFYDSYAKLCHKFDREVNRQGSDNCEMPLNIDLSCRLYDKLQKDVDPHAISAVQTQFNEELSDEHLSNKDKHENLSSLSIKQEELKSTPRKSSNCDIQNNSMEIDNSALIPHNQIQTLMDECRTTLGADCMKFSQRPNAQKYTDGHSKTIIVIDELTESPDNTD